MPRFGSFKDLSFLANVLLFFTTSWSCSGTKNTENRAPRYEIGTHGNNILYVQNGGRSQIQNWIFRKMDFRKWNVVKIPLKILYIVPNIILVSVNLTSKLGPVSIKLFSLWTFEIGFSLILLSYHQKLIRLTWLGLRKWLINMLPIFGEAKRPSCWTDLQSKISQSWGRLAARELIFVLNKVKEMSKKSWKKWFSPLSAMK